jgi:hypothetical protein
MTLISLDRMRRIMCRRELSCLVKLIDLVMVFELVILHGIVSQTLKSRTKVSLR